MTSPDSRRDSAGRLARAVWPLLALAALLLAAAAAGESGRLALRYDNQAIAAGQWWRLLSGHVVHLGAGHALLNLAGLALVAALFGRDFRPFQWVWLTLAGALVISVGFLLLNPGLAWYVGLSGVLHGFFAAGALRWIARGEAEGYVLAVFLVGKLAWEQAAGALPLSVTTSGGPVVVDAHLYGALAGAAVVLAWLRDWRGLRR